MDNLVHHQNDVLIRGGLELASSMLGKVPEIFWQMVVWWWFNMVKRKSHLQQIQIKLKFDTRTQTSFQAPKRATSPGTKKRQAKLPGPHLTTNTPKTSHRLITTNNGVRHYKTIPQGAPLPTEHSKITISHGIGCSLNLSIFNQCSVVFVSMGVVWWVWANNRSANFAALSAIRCYKKQRTFGLGPPPNKHNRFQYTLPSHRKKNMAHSGVEGGPRQKKLFFVAGGIMARKPRFNKQDLFACLWSGHLLICISYAPVSFDGHRILICTLGP